MYRTLCNEENFDRAMTARHLEYYYNIMYTRTYIVI